MKYDITEHGDMNCRFITVDSDGFGIYTYATHLELGCGVSGVPYLSSTIAVSGILINLPQTNNSNVCINCDTEMPQNARFCIECGLPVAYTNKTRKL